MIIGIDASHIRSGGGLSHLIEIITRISPESDNFEKILIWSSESTLILLPNFTWLIKKSYPLLNKTVVHSIMWKLLFRDNIVKNAGCNVLFLVDATYSRFHPSVSICHNILPFSNEAIKHFSFRDRIYIYIMRYNALLAFINADKVIMLSKNSIEVVSSYYKNIISKSVIIPHGINGIFNLSTGFEFNKEGVKKIVYISPLSPYKMQWKVIESVYTLLDLGYNVELTLIGNELNECKKRVDSAISKRPEYSFRIRYLGELPNQEIPKLLNNSHIFVFASLCESFGITLIEAMIIGIPIACSDRSVMPEILKDSGIYFNPNSSDEIANALREIIDNPVQAYHRSELAKKLATQYNWDKCAKDTLTLLKTESVLTSQNIV